MRPSTRLVFLAMGLLPLPADAQTARELRSELRVQLEIWEPSTGRLYAIWPLEHSDELRIFRLLRGEAEITGASLELGPDCLLELRELGIGGSSTLSFQVRPSDADSGLAIYLTQSSSPQEGRAILVRWRHGEERRQLDGVCRLRGNLMLDPRVRPTKAQPREWIDVSCTLGERLHVRIGGNEWDAGNWETEAFNIALWSDNQSRIRLRRLEIDGHVVPNSVRKLFRSARAARQPRDRMANEPPMAALIAAITAEERIEVASRDLPEMPWEKRERLRLVREMVKRSRKSDKGGGILPPGFEFPNLVLRLNPWPMYVMSRKQEAHEILLKAVQMYRVGSPGLAKMFLQDCGEIDPKAAIVPYLLGTIERERGRRQEAEQYFLHAAKLQSRFDEAWRAVGCLRFQDGDLSGAHTAFRRARNASSQDPWNAAYLGFIELVRGELSQATKYIRIAARLRPESKALVALQHGLKRLKTRPKWAVRHKAINAGYTVESSISKDLVERVAAQLLRFREFLEERFPLAKKHKGRLPVWIFDSEEEYLAFTETINQRAEHTVGVYHPMTKTVLLFEGIDAPNNRRVLYHEAWHQYLHQAISNQPAWFNEGLAEYWGSTSFDTEGRAHEGAVLRALSITLEQHKTELVPFDQIMRLNRLWFLDSRRVDLHYAQSWAMVHWFLHGQNMEVRELFATYSQELLSTDSGEDAWAATFGALPSIALRTLQEEFALYVAELLRRREG